MPYLNPEVMAKAIDRVVDSVAADYESDIRQLSARLSTYEAALRELLQSAEDATDMDGVTQSINLEMAIERAHKALEYK